MDHENAYEGLVEADADARWAFGTGFDDPLAGVDTAAPPGVDGPALAAYCLGLGDDSLLLAQRLAEWCTRAPELEEEVALANVGLDLLGQTRLLYARAAAADPGVVPVLPEDSPVPAEDRLAFFRDAAGFRNVGLVEHPNGDFAELVVRLVLFSAWRLALLEGLRGSADPVLSAIGEKGVKDVRYHRDYAARWFVTLAGGTEESRSRTVRALTVLWPYAEELRGSDPLSVPLVPVGVAPDAGGVWAATADFLTLLWDRAGLAPDEGSALGVVAVTGRTGVHTPWLGPLLEEMQSIARAHPLGRW